MFINKPKHTISDNDKLYINPSISIITDNDDMNKVICTENIKKNSILIKEYSIINLFGEKVINRDIEFLIKLIEYNDELLYPRNITQFKSIEMTREILKKIKKMDRFNKYSNDYIEFYYAKHLFNSFEGFEYGPLYLPHIAKLNHSCNPNTYFEFNKDYGYMTLYAKNNIKKGEELTNSYLLNKDIDNHMKYLKNHYQFNYECLCNI